MSQHIFSVYAVYFKYIYLYDHLSSFLDAPFKGSQYGQPNIQLKLASKDCTVVRGTKGVISNPRTFDCMFVGGCYEANKHHCWKVVSDCKTIKVKFDKFIVEEYLSTENTCPYDKVILTHGATSNEFCDHSAASKDQQVKRFTPKRDPSAKGMFRWQTMASNTFQVKPFFKCIDDIIHFSLNS